MNISKSEHNWLYLGQETHNEILKIIDEYIFG